MKKRLSVLPMALVLLSACAGTPADTGSGIAFRCPLDRTVITNTTTPVRHGGRSEKADVCFVTGMNRDNQPESQRWLFQVFRLDYVDGTPSPEEKEREDAIRTGMHRLWPLRRGQATTFMYSERVDGGALTLVREDWRPLYLGSQNLSGRGTFTVERRRERLFVDVQNVIITTYWFDEITGAIVRSVVTAERGIMTPTPPSTAQSTHFRTVELPPDQPAGPAAVTPRLP